MTVRHDHHTTKHLFRRMIQILLSVLVSLSVLLYLGIAVYGAYSFNQVPDRHVTYTNTPADYGMVYQDVSFPSAYTDQLTLREWWIPNPCSERVLIMVHGKASSRSEYLPVSQQLYDAGYNLLAFDLRGHGASDGNHYTFGQYESWDVVGAFNFVEEQGFTAQNIGVFGKSMGAATSLLAMGHSTDIITVFSDSAFADFEKIAEEQLPKEKGLPTFFLPGILTAGHIMYGFDINETRPEAVVQSIRNRHIFLTHGEADNVIPVSNVYRLQKAGGSNITGIWIVPGADHTQAINMYPTEYMRTLTTFFDTYLGHE